MRDEITPSPECSSRTKNIIDDHLHCPRTATAFLFIYSFLSLRGQLNVHICTQMHQLQTVTLRDTFSFSPAKLFSGGKIKVFAVVNTWSCKRSAFNAPDRLPVANLLQVLELLKRGVVLLLQGSSSPSLSLNCGGHWGTTDDFTTSFLYSALFSTALCDLANSCPFLEVVFPPLFLSVLYSSPLPLCLARWFLPDLMNGRHVHTNSVCVSLQWSGGLRMVRSLAGSWRRLPRW